MLFEFDLEPAKLVRAKDAALAAYLRLAAKATEARCGGVFAGAATWGTREWLVNSGVTKEEAEDAAADGLVSWSGSDLVIIGLQTPAQRKARKAAEARWGGPDARASAEHEPSIERASAEHPSSIAQASSKQEGGLGGGVSDPLIPGSESESDLESDPPLSSDQTRARAKQEYSRGFLDFWHMYPRKTGKGKAARAYETAKVAMGGNVPLLNAIGEALAWQRVSAQWTKDGGTFIPHPTTYLAQRRWEDEPEGARGPVIDEHTNGLVGRFLGRTG